MKGRVLVVDDEPTVRSWLAALLAHEGYIVEEAADGAAALEALRSFAADVIILDLIMPGMNGRQFLLELREDPKLATTPVLVWTAVKGVHINLTTLGATEILEKEPDPDEILRKVALASYRAHGQRHSPTQPPVAKENYEPPSNASSEVVLVLDAVRSRWPRRVGELAAGGFTALPRIEPMPKALRLARALDAVAVLVERSAVAAEPTLAELTAEGADHGVAIREFDATTPGVDEELLAYLQGCVTRRRAARRGDEDARR
jgi:DNA-binding response OmpR family regulator